MAWQQTRCQYLTFILCGSGFIRYVRADYTVSFHVLSCAALPNITQSEEGGGKGHLRCANANAQV